VGAPIGIGLVAGIAFPAMIIGWYILSGLYYIIQYRMTVMTV